jgi:tRNA U34 5-carboxymethylaminomethyl modifying enzyme MnmG/GidA
LTKSKLTTRNLTHQQLKALLKRGELYLLKYDTIDTKTNSYCSSIHVKIRQWRKAKINIDNQGKMPLIVFGNGLFNPMAIRGHQAAPIKKIFSNLKQRERLGQALVLEIDEYLTSQVHNNFRFL